MPVKVPTLSNVRFQRALKTLNTTVYDIIQDRRRNGKEGTNDLLSMLIEARDEETGEGMTDEQLRDEVMTLLLAGHETTASSLGWTWYFLSKYPDVERKLHQEVDEVLGGRTPTLEDPPKLKYTLQVFEEVLRMCPPIWATSRDALVADENRRLHDSQGRRSGHQPVPHTSPSRLLGESRGL